MFALFAAETSKHRFDLLGHLIEHAPDLLAWGLRAVYPLLARNRQYFLRRVYGDASRIPAGAAESYAVPLQMSGTIDHLLAVVRGASWPAMSSRYERGSAARRAPDPEHPGEIWKALDRGEDPTGD